MAHYISVLFFPIEKNDCLTEMENWEAILPLWEKVQKDIEKNKVRRVISRNWWFQKTLDLICKGLNIEDLEFVTAEVICLTNEDLNYAKKALDKVLNQISDGVPYLGTEIEADNCIWYLHHYYDGQGNIKEYTQEQKKDAFEEAKSEFRVINYSDNDYKSKVDFFSFVKTLKQSVDDCLLENKLLIYVQFQP